MAQVDIVEVNAAPLSRGRPAIDPLGAVLTVVAGAALLWLPFAVFKANRIVPGDPRDLFDVLPARSALACYAVLACVGVCALTVSNARLRLAAALLGIVAISLAVAAMGDLLTPAGNRVVRVSPGPSFWLVLTSLGLLATDAITRMRPGPGLRVLFLLLFFVVALLALAHGTFDHLSVMREYAVNADRFAREVRQHVLLAIGVHRVLPHH